MPRCHSYSLWLPTLLLLSSCHCGNSFPLTSYDYRLSERTLLSVSASPDEEEEDAPHKENKCDMFRKTLRRLAQLSLQDYEWRSSVFKSNEADRMVEESIARMRGEDPAYVRPMDASERTIGPLGRWEKQAVECLSKLMDEEGRRAKKIVNSDGELVRPIDASNEEDELGPLGFLEKTVVDFLESIRASETERVRTKTLRPKDLDVSKQGPLGRLEQEFVRILDEIKESERLRAEQSRKRGGEIVRPIDVPGPLGEFEMAVSELFLAEEMRSKEREKNSGQLVRPKDAKRRGPLGEAELQAYETIKQLNAEEMERLRSIGRILEENRPINADRNSIFGILERLVVGILRAPQMLMSVVDRVKELLESESLSEFDQKILKGTDQGVRSDSPSGGSEKNNEP